LVCLIPDWGDAPSESAAQAVAGVTAGRLIQG
jgi:hypothetical protein